MVFYLQGRGPQGNFERRPGGQNQIIYIFIDFRRFYTITRRLGQDMEYCDQFLVWCKILRALCSWCTSDECHTFQGLSLEGTC